MIATSGAAISRNGFKNPARIIMQNTKLNINQGIKISLVIITSLLGLYLPLKMEIKPTIIFAIQIGNTTAINDKETMIQVEPIFACNSSSIEEFIKMKSK